MRREGEPGLADAVDPESGEVKRDVPGDVVGVASGQWQDGWTDVEGLIIGTDDHVDSEAVAVDTAVFGEIGRVGLRGGIGGQGQRGWTCHRFHYVRDTIDVDSGAGWDTGELDAGGFT